MTQPTQTQNSATRPSRRRSTIVAGLLSAVLPGAGHLYIRQFGRGVSYIGLAVVMGALLWWAQTTSEFEVFPGMMPLLSVLAGLYWLAVLVSAVTNALNDRIPQPYPLLLVLGFTYLLGWQAIEVNLQKFFGEFPDTFNILTRVLWPWNAAIEREETLLIASTEFGNPCQEGEIPEQVRGTSEEAWVIVDPACGEFGRFVVGSGLQTGTPLTVSGGGFAPNAEVEVWWEDPIGQEFQPRFEGNTVITQTDGAGDFSIQFAAPQYEATVTQVGVQYHGVQARQVESVGDLRLTQEFSLAINRMIVTIFQALMATTFGIILAIPLSFLAAHNIMGHSWVTRPIYYGVRFVLNVTRSIEPIIWAVIAAVWVGLGPFAGVIALTVHTIASLGKLYSEAIESIDSGPIEAITATGANRIQTIVYGIIPQVIPPFLSFTIYRWDINVRMSTIIGFVGGGGIGQLLFQWINQSRWSAAGMSVWLIAITVSVMDYASAELRKKFI